MKTFLDFLTESGLADVGYHGPDGNWINAYTGQRFDVTDNEYHWVTIAKNHEAFGVRDEDKYLIQDGQYGRFYRQGWIRWIFDYDTYMKTSLLKVTSSEKVLKSQKGQSTVADLMRELNAGVLWIGNEYDEIKLGKDYWHPTFSVKIKGQEAKKILDGGKLNL